MGLKRAEPREQPLLGHQLSMAAAFDNAAFIERKDHVGVGDGRQTVGDNQGGSADHQTGQGVLNLPLGLAVEGAGRLIQQQEWRVLENGPRDGDALALAA